MLFRAFRAMALQWSRKLEGMSGCPAPGLVKCRRKGRIWWSQGVGRGEVSMTRNAGRSAQGPDGQGSAWYMGTRLCRLIRNGVWSLRPWPHPTQGP